MNGDQDLLDSELCSNFSCALFQCQAMSLATSKVVTLSPRAAGTVKAIANPPVTPIYYRPGSKNQKLRQFVSPNYGRPNSRGIYRPPIKTRPHTPHDHFHEWKPNTPEVMPEHLITTGTSAHEKKYVDPRTLHRPPSPYTPTKERPQKERILAAVSKLRETYEHRSSGFYDIFRKWELADKSAGKTTRSEHYNGGVDAQNLYDQCIAHGIRWMNYDDCVKMIEHYKRDPNNEPGRLHFKDWMHMTCKHAAEFSNWDSEYDPFKEGPRKRWKSLRLRKSRCIRNTPTSNPFRRDYNKNNAGMTIRNGKLVDKESPQCPLILPRPSTADDSIVSRNEGKVSPHLLHIMDDYRTQILEAKKKTVGMAPLHASDFKTMFSILKSRYSLPVNETDMEELKTYLDPNNDGEISHYELVSRLARGHQELKRITSRPPSSRGSIRSHNEAMKIVGGNMQNLGTEQYVIPGYVRPQKSRRIITSPRTRRFVDRVQMFDVSVNYDGTPSPRMVRENQTALQKVPCGRQWTASSIARQKFLEHRQSQEATRALPDRRGKFGRLR